LSSGVTRWFRSAGQVPSSKNGVHESTVDRARETVPQEQVPVKAEALRGRHVTLPLRNTGEANDRARIEGHVSSM